MSTTTTTTRSNNNAADALHAVAAEQRRELMEAEAFESDLDLAFHLQLQEAINASLSLQPSASSSPTPLSPPPPPAPLQPDGDALNFSRLQSQELSKFEQELKDCKLSESEFRKIRDDLHRRIHDNKLAAEIARMPDDEWEEYGDNYEKPYGEGSSKAVDNEVFRVYCKGLVEESSHSKTQLAAIGVAICDSRDELLFELKKPLVLNGASRQCAVIKALIEGLSAAHALQLSRVVFYCDYYPVFQYVMGRWLPKQRKVITLLNQVRHIREKFTSCHASFVARNEIKFAFKLAREAIVSQMNRPADSSNPRNLYETCAICLEDTDVSKIFSIDGCLHRYCNSCMKQHVEAKLLQGLVPKCPHEKCNSELNIDSCGKFLTPKLIEIMGQRIKEASIPVTEKVYCPYPKCSALMSRDEVLEYSSPYFTGVEISRARKCIKCNGQFCIICKVPWHKNMTCLEYRIRNPGGSEEDLKLKSLAARNLWRQCIKCNHMIELAAGCYHMTCRCGYEFCYTCGAEWKDKKATCQCPLFVYDDSDEDFVDEEEEDEEEDFYDSDSDEYYF